MKKTVEFASPICLMKFVVFVVLLLANPSYGVEVTLAWDPSPDAQYYVVYWGTTSGNYSYNSIDAGIGEIVETKCSINIEYDKRYYFVVKSAINSGTDSIRSSNSREITVILHSEPVRDGEHEYDGEWGISNGDYALTGLKFLFDASQGVPTLASADNTPDVDFPGIRPLGLPLRFEPANVAFSPPVKIYLPCPVPAETDIYYYPDNASGWILANDAGDPDRIQPGAEEWMVTWLDNTNVRRARENIPESSPPTVAIKVQHFSAVQLGMPDTAIESTSGGGGGGGGCLITTAADGGDLPRRPLLSVLIAIGGVVFATLVGWIRLRSKNR